MDVATGPAVNEQFNRTSSKSGWCCQSKLPKGPNGRNLCRQCGVEVPKGRLTFCSDGCVDEWKIKTNPGHARRLVFKRDHGVCCLCGRDTEALTKELKQLRDQTCKRLKHNIWGGGYYPRLQRHEDNLFAARCRALMLPHNLWQLCQSLWEMDHKVAVIEGGGCCGLENLRTLCWDCHRRETRYLRGRLAGHQQLELPFWKARG